MRRQRLVTAARSILTSRKGQSAAIHGRRGVERFFSLSDKSLVILAISLQGNVLVLDVFRDDIESVVVTTCFEIIIECFKGWFGPQGLFKFG